MAQLYTQEEVYKIFREHGLEPLEPYINCKIPTKCLNKEGYVGKIKLDSVQSGKTFGVFSTLNPYVLDNIKRFIDIDTNGEYEYVDGVFENAYSVFTIRHKTCGRIFQSKWVNLHRKASDKEPNRHGTRCPFCNANQLESTHALILKQVWQHEEPDTVVEDKSCINPNTNCPLPTDIVNHRLKVAIEIQSWFHDFEDQKIKDRIKKQFWLDKGYHFYAPDSRNYTPLQMIQLFFPEITEIPDYIDFGYDNKIDDVAIQKMLDKGMFVTDIADKLGISAHRIYDGIQNSRLAYPDNYIPKCNDPVVQLDMNGNFIASYDSYSQTRENGFNPQCILKAVHAPSHYSSDYLWIDKNDYESGNYTLEESRPSKVNIPENQYDKYGNFIRHYNTVNEAAKDIGLNAGAILRVLRGERKTVSGYHYSYL